MFTGLVETFGSVTSVRKGANSIVLAIRPSVEYSVQPGDSVCVNGVCLTVTGHGGDISFDVSPETLRSTNLGELRPGDRVNLERALRLSDRLGGHIVTGHIDGVGTVREKHQEGDYTFYTIEAPADILKYIVQKGSVAVDGISLTVTGLGRGTFGIAIIPHTLKATSIDMKGVGSRVNLEADIIGKYVEKLLGRQESGSGLMDLLKEKGFTND